MTDITSIGRTIKEAREARGWTPEELGDRIDRSGLMVEDWEAGRLDLDADVRAELASVLDLDVRDLGVEGPTALQPAAAAAAPAAAPAAARIEVAGPEGEAPIAAVRADAEPVLDQRPESHAAAFDPGAWFDSASRWVRNRWRRRRFLARAPVRVPSYLEDDRQVTSYRIRGVLTVAAVVVLLLLMRWAWGQFSEATTSLFDTLRSAV